MPKKDPAKLTSVKIKIPWVGEAEWNADPKERNAAWALYVELVTRVAVQALPANEGSLREVLTSLHSLFDSTREILREAGPDIGASITSVGGPQHRHRDGLPLSAGDQQVEQDRAPAILVHQFDLERTAADQL